MITCPECGGTNVMGECIDYDYNDDECWRHYEPVNAATSYGDLRFYSHLECEDCGAEWDGEW